MVSSRGVVAVDVAGAGRAPLVVVVLLCSWLLLALVWSCTSSRC